LVPGPGRSSLKSRSRTSGASVADAAAGAERPPATTEAGRAADGASRGQNSYARAATANAPSAAASRRWRSLDTVGPQSVVGREIDGEGQRLVPLAFDHRQIVDDNKLRGTLEIVDELAQSFVVALEHHPNRHLAEQLLLVHGLDVRRAALVLDPGLPHERRQTGVGDAPGPGKIRGQDLLIERLQLLVRLHLSAYETLRGQMHLLGDRERACRLER